MGQWPTLHRCSVLRNWVRRGRLLLVNVESKNVWSRGCAAVVTGWLALCGLTVGVTAQLPPLVPPPGVINRLSVAAFNELWYRKAPRARSGRAVFPGSRGTAHR